MRFVKMHGLGNDYVYIDCFKEQVSNPAALSVRVSDRHFGIGSDGLVLICPSQTADLMMDIYNADGSRAKMCGNAIRCIGKYAYESGLVNKTEITVETLSGIKTLRLNVEGGRVCGVRVDMGAVSFNTADLPMHAGVAEAVGYPVSVDGETYHMTCVSVGNPHAVIFVEDVENAPVRTVGPEIENNPLFPEGVNVEFAKVIDKNTVEMRVWERGSGETMACGTGACAVFAACRRHALCEPRATVKLLGGDLIIEEENGRVFMTGGADLVFTGEYFAEESAC